MPARVVAPTSVKGGKVELDRARRRTLADHDVDLEIFQGRVEDLLDHRREPMDLVDEQNVVGFEVGEQRREIAGALQHGTGGLAQIDAHLARDDVSERGLAQPGRPEQQDVIERLVPIARCLDEDGELRADLLLTDVLAAGAWAAAPARSPLPGRKRDRGRSVGRSRSRLHATRNRKRKDAKPRRRREDHAQKTPERKTFSVTGTQNTAFAPVPAHLFRLCRFASLRFIGSRPI